LFLTFSVASSIFEKFNGKKGQKYYRHFGDKQSSRARGSPFSLLSGSFFVADF
jgi:hypothetical protein